MDYSAIVFDTAPTGHTLRLLQFPSTLEKGLSKLMDLQGAMGGMLSQLASMFGQGGPGLQQGLFSKLTEMKVNLSCFCIPFRPFQIILSGKNH